MQPTRTEPYRTVPSRAEPYRTMQWKSAITHPHVIPKLYYFLFSLEYKRKFVECSWLHFHVNVNVFYANTKNGEFLFFKKPAKALVWYIPNPLKLCDTLGDTRKLCVTFKSYSLKISASVLMRINVSSNIKFVNKSFFWIGSFQWISWY